MQVLEPVHYTLMPTWTKIIPGIDKHWFAFMPLPMAVQVPWYKIFGYTIFSVRLYSFAWALVALVACFFLVRKITSDQVIAVLAVVLIAIDQIFIRRATIGRMDMMSAALGLSGLSLYVNLRETHLNRAIWMGNACIVAAGLSHPNGGVLSFLGLMFLVAFDYRRLRWRHAVLALLPYLVGGLGMAAYISIDPANFWAQFTANSTGRLGAITSPFSALWNELLYRYLRTFGFDKGASLEAGLRVFPLLVYLAALAVVLLVRDFRRVPGYRTLALLTVIYMLGLTFLDNFKIGWYLVYVTPWLAMLTAIVARWAWDCLPRSAVAAVLLLMMVIPVASTLRLIARNPYSKQYLPTIRFLNDHAGPGQIVMGSSALLFGYGIRDTLVDDDRLGFYSGKRPAMIVVDELYQSAFGYYSKMDQGLNEHIRRCFDTEFRPEFRNDKYTVWVRRR
jgi:4-amino-4-deoxy-L-arabinose transferase-like glycosyltransferase